MTAESLQIDASPQIELHAFGFQQHPLQLVRVSYAAWTDLAPRVDHAMPRDVAALGQMVQRVADLPGVSCESGQLGDLSVRRDAAPRNSPDGRTNHRVAVHARAL